VAPNRIEILPPKNRRDHIVPQGFLRGFLHSSQNPRSGKLQVYAVATRSWQEATPDEICYKLGYYDYSDLSPADATADDAFRDLENKITPIRESIREAKYLEWERHRDDLVAFFQMLRARSELFRAQVIAEQKTAGSYLQVQEWISSTTFRYVERAWADTPNLEELLKNKSITDARAQIAKGSGDWGAFSWTLGVTDIGMPFMTSDVPVVMSGRGPDWRRELQQGTVWIGVPFGWDMCLIGTPAARVGAPTRWLSRQEVIAVNSGPLSAANVVISAVRLPRLQHRLEMIKRAVPMAPT
jgi:hypothetical protein